MKTITFKNPVLYISSKTSLPKNGDAVYGFCIEDNGSLVEGRGFAISGNTHTGNLIGLNEALSILDANKDEIETLSILSDSAVVNNFLKTVFSGKPKVNPNVKEIKDKTLEYLDRIKNGKKVSISLLKTTQSKPEPSHQIARRNAERALSILLDNDDLEKVVLERPKGKVPEVYSKPVMISGNRIFFHTSSPEKMQNEYVYLGGTFKTWNKDTDRSFKYLGKPDSDAHLCVVIRDKPYEILDTLIRKCVVKDNNNEPMILPAMINLQTVTKPAVWKDINSNVQSVNCIQGMLLSNDNFSLGTVLNPAKLSFKLFNQLNDIYAELRNYLNGDLEGKVIDITDTLFTKNSNGRLKLSDNFKVPDKEIRVEFEEGGKVYELFLCVTTDLPVRTVFSGLLKEDKDIDIKVSVLIHSGHKNRYRVSTVVSTPGSHGIYSAPYSGYKLVKLKR